MPEFSPLVRNIHDAMSIRYNTRIYDLKQRGVDVIVLSLGEAFFELPPLPLDAASCAAGAHYSHSRGLPALREALAAYHRDTHALQVDPQQNLLITAGSKIAIHMTMMALLSPGDDVAIPEPAWVSYSEQARLCGANPIMIPFDAPIDAWNEYITPLARLLVLSNPNNPTGRILTAAEMLQLIDFAHRRDLIILADEAYSAFTPKPFISFGGLDPAFDRVVICNSLSKNLGVSGWRIGYAIGARPVIDQLLKINQHLITCAPTVLQQSAAEHFDALIAKTTPQIRELLAKREKVAAMLRARNLQPLPGDATFYFFLSIGPSNLRSVAFCDRLLAEHNVCAVPGLGYGPSCNQFVRISIGTEPLDRIEHALDCMRTLIDATSPAGVHAHAACA